MRTCRVVLVAVLLGFVTGCYAARVETGLPPSGTVVKKTFASCWLYGLVPPSTIKTEALCPDGVAIVETQLSFVNQVVGILTLGIYTPMQIVVTCANKTSAEMFRPEAEFEVSLSASDEEVQAVFMRAADEAVRSGKPALVRATL